MKEMSNMAREIKVHTTFCLIEKFKNDTSLTENEKMLLKYLPHKVQNIIWELHSSMMFPIPYCFSTILTAVSGSIANSKVLCTNNGYTVHPNIFMAIIGESGENKSQPIKWFTKPIWERAAEILEEYNKDLEHYQRETAKGNLDVEKPRKTQYIIQDATIEATKEILHENPRGIIDIFDELALWINSFSRYKKGHASEQGEWIVIYDGDDLLVNRKGNSKVLHIKHPFVSLIGSIQPYILCDSFKGAGTEDGLLWRILMTHSEHPACPILWNDEQPNENLKKEWSKILLSIFDQSLDVDYDHPKQIRYTEVGWSTIRNWQNETEREYTSSHPQKEISVWRKVQVNVHKIALILKVLWMACDEDVLELGDGDNGDLPTDDDPRGNDDFIGMQMAKAATDIMDYYLEGALQTLDMMSKMFPKPLSAEQKSFLRLLPADRFIARSEILVIGTEYGMRPRTIDRYLGQLKGSYLESQHGRYRLSNSGKMAISGEKYQPKHV